MTGSVILVKRGIYVESLNLKSDKTLLIKGGYNSTYDQQTANATFIQAPGPTSIKGVERFFKMPNDKCEINPDEVA